MRSRQTLNISLWWEYIMKAVEYNPRPAGPWQLLSGPPNEIHLIIRNNIIYYTAENKLYKIAETKQEFNTRTMLIKS